MPGPTAVFEAFVTIAVTIFIVELTDKDALLLLSLATTKSARSVFAVGSIAFTLTSGTSCSSVPPSSRTF